MPYEFKLPEAGTGEEAEEGIVVAWFKREGAQVKKGEPLLEVQFAKVSSEVVAPISGKLQRILAPRDAVIKAGQVLALILEPGDEASEAQAPAAASQEEAAAGEKERFIPASPAARRLAKEKGVDLAAVQGTGAGGRISQEDVARTIAAQRTAPAGREVRASPIAKRVAQEHGIDLATVTGTGPEGRITEQDVRKAVQARTVEPPSHEVEALTPMRRTIARRMVESLQTAAQLTLISEADVTELVALRERLRAQYDVSYTDLIVKAVALALTEHPRMNARLIGDELHLLPEINIGVAVALDAGLVVPVIRDTQTKDVAAIAEEAKALIERTRGGKLTEQEMRGGTFTVTNLGAYGVDAFTPIINPPEVAILGVGRISEQLVRRGDGMAWRHKMGLSLTFDHRAVDGAPAAAFLQSICGRLEAPESLVR